MMPVGREQLALLGAIRGQRLEPLDPTHHQPAGDMFGPASAGERGEVDLGDLGVGDPAAFGFLPDRVRSEEHTSELQSLMRISYAVFCLKQQKNPNQHDNPQTPPLLTTTT